MCSLDGVVAVSLSMEDLNLSLLQDFYVKNVKDFSLKIDGKANFIQKLLNYFNLQLHKFASRSQQLQRQEDDVVLFQEDSLQTMNELNVIIDCIRICLRNQDHEVNKNLETTEFIDKLLFLASSNPNQQQNSSFYHEINLHTSAIRCLTNLLNLNSYCVELFLSLNGLTWLLRRIQDGGHVVHMFYFVRLLYMLLSQR